MATRLIGSGTTDSQGKININYTGTGAGKLQLIAKQGNILSETYELYDTLFFDKATTGNKNTSWYNSLASSGDMTVTTTGTGTLLENTHTTNNGFYAANAIGTPSGSSDVYDWTYGLCVEFDLNSYTGDCGFQIADTTRVCSRNFAQLNAPTNGCHIKIEFEQTQCLFYVDGALQWTCTNTLGDAVIRFVVRAGQTLEYKNFMIYSI